MSTQRQQGLSGAGWFLVIVLIFSAASVGVRLIPIYIDHRTLGGLITDLIATPEAATMTSRQFHEELQKDLRINNIREFELKEMLEFERRDGFVRVNVNYEVREPLFANIDLILSFEEQYERIVN